MMPARLLFGLVAAVLFLTILGPARRLAQIVGRRTGRTLPVAFHRLLCLVLGVRVRRHRGPKFRPKAADRRQPCVLAGRPAARCDRTDDFPGEKGNRRAVPGPSGRLAAGDRLRRSSAQTWDSRGQRQYGAHNARARAGLAVRRGDDGRRQSSSAVSIVAFRGNWPDALARRPSGVWRSRRPAGLPALFQGLRPARRPKRAPDCRLVRRHDVPAASLALAARGRRELRCLLRRSDPGSGFAES